MNEIYIFIERFIRIAADNKLIIALFKNPQYYVRTKYINVAYYFQRYKMQKGIIKFIKIFSQNMAADELIKLFPKIKFERFLYFIDMGEY
jgi:hypothetical protein